MRTRPRTRMRRTTTKITMNDEAVKEKIKEPLDKINSEKALSSLEEKMKAVDEAFEGMEDAEMPFMTGNQPHANPR